MTRRTGLAPALLLLAGLAPIGCGPTPIDTTYGRSRGTSINGTGAFAELLRQRGHEVRAAVRLNDTMGEWAQSMVRFSTHPGPPAADEGRRMLEWLQARPGRSLVYVARDFDAGPEFWEAMLAALPRDAPATTIDRLKRSRDRARSWVADLPPKPKTPAPAKEWFAVDPKPDPPSTCKQLDGPWSDGVDPRSAAIPKHAAFAVEEGEQPVLLRGDGAPLVIAWTLDNGSRVLALANASFLLNAALMNRSRRPLAVRVADWIGPGPAHVAFGEGSDLMAQSAGDGSPSSSPFHLLGISPFDRIAAHVLVFLLILAMAHAVRLGRPRPEPPSGVERPSAHPEALGSLLARTGRADSARSLLEAYRRWRHPSAGPSRAPGRASPTASPSSPSSPRA